MAHCNTVLSQILRIFPRHKFENLSRQFPSTNKMRTFSRWTQFVALVVGQLAGRDSLRGIVDCFSGQNERLYHLGIKPFSRATLARANEQDSAPFFKALFEKLLEQCQVLAPRNTSFNLKDDGNIYLLDATTIQLPLSLFPWAEYRTSKGAVKMHMGLSADGYLPTFVDMSKGNKHEINIARQKTFPKGSYLIFDRGYTDYQWYESLTKQKVYFVTRLKSNSSIERGTKRSGRKSEGVLEDCEISLYGTECSYRLVRYIDNISGEEYSFLTNATHLQAVTVAQLYKERWQVELFFKWIKQNLKVKSFIGTSINAVQTQLWIALCVYLILNFLKFQSKISQSILQILRILQLNLFERRSLESLFGLGDPKIPRDIGQLSLL